MAILAAQGAREAKERIRAWVESGHPFDANDASHIAAYRALKQITRRVSPQAMARYLEGANKKLNHGGEQKVEYYGIPVKNFPGGLPDDIEKSRIDPEELECMHLAPGLEVDVKSYYIVDKEAEPLRFKMGKHVQLLAFWFSSSATMKGSKADRTGGQPASSSGGAEPLVPANNCEATSLVPPNGGGAQPLVPANGGGAQPLVPANDAGCSSGRVPKRFLSDPSDTEEPDAKKMRTLVGTLKALKTSITEAGAKGNFYSENKLNQTNVHYLSKETISVLKELRAISAKDDFAMASIKKACSRTCTFLADTLMQYPKYEELQHFTDLFTAFEEMGVTMDGQTCLLKSLATLPKDSNDLPEAEAADGAARSAFRRCKMYKDFIDHRIMKAMLEAKAAVGDERSRILRQCAEVECSPALLEKRFGWPQRHSTAQPPTTSAWRQQQQMPR